MVQSGGRLSLGDLFLDNVEGDPWYFWNVRQPVVRAGSFQPGADMASGQGGLGDLAGVGCDC